MLSDFILQTFFSLYKSLYDPTNGPYCKADLKKFVQGGTLTKQGYQEIVGEPYEMEQTK